ncbi:AAA family ATPase [Sorangium sp. So ce1014]|uniref:AAA family ATPase n=1 Tax=Sorangium sp. So ce1014 TaxID=3133326 RepID=UPI003F6406A9
MLRALELVEVGPAPAMRLELGRRLNLMTGDNGLGKSFVLDVIWWALSGSWARSPAWPLSGAKEPKISYRMDDGTGDTSWFHFESQEWSPVGTRPRALVLYAKADGSFALWDPARNLDPEDYTRPRGSKQTSLFAASGATRRSPAYLFDPDEVLDGKLHHGKTICNGLIRDWVSWQEKKPETQGGRAFQHLCEALEQLSPNPQGGAETILAGKPVRLFVDDTREFPTIDTGYGEVPVIHASAGMRRIISLAYLIVWAWHEHVEASRLLKQEPVSELVFLVDEVENHLHPEWQRRIAPALLRVLEALAPSMRVQAHITTHAPMVLASLEPHFDPERDKLFVFDLEARTVALREVPWARFGDASRWLTSPAFNLHRARSIEAEQAIDDASALMRGEEPHRARTREEVDRALHDTLADQDPFWPRWLAFIEERGT